MLHRVLVAFALAIASLPHSRECSTVPGVAATHTLHHSQIAQVDEQNQLVSAVGVGDEDPRAGFIPIGALKQPAASYAVHSQAHAQRPRSNSDHAMHAYHARQSKSRANSESAAASASTHQASSSSIESLSDYNIQLAPEYDRITELQDVAIVVNDANPTLSCGSCESESSIADCSVIFKAAGCKKLTSSCQALLRNNALREGRHASQLHVTQCAITPAFDLATRGVQHILHAVSPVLKSTSQLTSAQITTQHHDLRLTYWHALHLASEKLSAQPSPHRSIGIPCLAVRPGSRIDRWAAAHTALAAMRDWLLFSEANRAGITQIVLVPQTEHRIYTQLLPLYFPHSHQAQHLIRAAAAVQAAGEPSDDRGVSLSLSPSRHRRHSTVEHLGAARVHRRPSVEFEFSNRVNY